jgi:uncharacterized protein YjbI with pentapeptide repeats
VILAVRAPVRPRVIAPQSGEAILLEDAIGPYLQAHVHGPIAIVGPIGSGKSTAIRHLASLVPRSLHALLLDEPDFRSVMEGARYQLVIYAARALHAAAHIAEFRLAPWTDDEVLEYLMERHREACASALKRLRGSADRGELAGNPELLSLVLERLSADAGVADARTALCREVEGLFPDGARYDDAGRVCLAALQDRAVEAVAGLRELLLAGASIRAARALRHRAIQVVVGAQRLARDLEAGRPTAFLAGRLPDDLLAEAAAAVRDRPRALDHLRLLTRSDWRAAHATAASLLVGTGWRPDPLARCDLRKAVLRRASWASADLERADLRGADLSDADLEDACLDGTSAAKARFRAVRARRMSMCGMWGVAADFTGADLTDATGDLAHLERARFDGARMDGARLPHASLREASFDGAGLFMATLRGADLRGASLRNARLALSCLVSARLEGADIEGADFAGANLEAADLTGLPLRRAAFSGVRLACARMNRCDLEGLFLPGVVLEGASLTLAILTGARLPRAKLRRATLGGARLADVDLEGADLSQADLRHATFHMGSSRSGLLFLGPSEGTRTGFYTDEALDMRFKRPEEVRVANLRGADLRGARLDGTDFYLVDLREARYTPEQEAHFRRGGAIL